jgi:hypothetical protein
MSTPHRSLVSRARAWKIPVNPNVFKMLAGLFAVPLLWLAWGFLSGKFDGRDFPAASGWIILRFGSLTGLFLWLGRARNARQNPHAP